jgi:hypothetical protein
MTLGARNRHRWFGRRDTCIPPNWESFVALVNRPESAGNGAWRWLASGSMTREAVLQRFNSAHDTVSTICRISFACTQVRIETK